MLSPSQQQALSKGERAHRTLVQVFQALVGSEAVDCTAICTDFRKFVVDESKALMYISFVCPESLPLLVETKLGAKVHDQFNAKRADFAVLVLKVFGDVAFDCMRQDYKASLFKAHAAVQFTADACGVVQANIDLPAVANTVVQIMGQSAKLDKNKAKLMDQKSSKMHSVEYNTQVGDYVRVMKEFEDQVCKMGDKTAKDPMVAVLMSMFAWLGVAADAVDTHRDKVESAMIAAETFVNDRISWMILSVVEETAAVVEALDGLPHLGADDAASQADFLTQVLVKKVMEANQKLGAKWSKVR